MKPIRVRRIADKKSASAKQWNIRDVHGMCVFLGVKNAEIIDDKSDNLILVDRIDEFVVAVPGEWVVVFDDQTFAVHSQKVFGKLYDIEAGSSLSYLLTKFKIKLGKIFQH